MIKIVFHLSLFTYLFKTKTLDIKTKREMQIQH